MIKRIDERGGVYHEPPYTPEEEADFYRRVADGPVTVVKPPAAAEPQDPAPQPPQPGEEHRS